jgi:crotonobetainyl-CoA:carnitine CoA-transferase CaiB-like acyl-CoA transferase
MTPGRPQPNPAPARRGDGPPRPLEGIRVVDFTRLLPGAFCTWLLATLGAEIVKVEQPGRGDYQRDLGRPAGPRGSALFQLVNQGKRSLALDLKQQSAAPVLASLLASADIVVEGFRPGVAARLGIDFDALTALRPELVCVSISGFGSAGPLKSLAAHDINYLALSGWLHRSVAAGDAIPEIPLADLLGGGLVPTMNAIALLLRAKLSGIGGIVDASLADAVPLLPTDVLAAALAGGPAPARHEMEFSGSGPRYRVYALSDGHVAVGAVEDRFWGEFCRRMGIDPESPADAALAAGIAARFRAMSRDEVERLFAGADACVTVLRTTEEALASPHAQARQFTRPAPSPGAMPLIGSPFFHDGRRQFAEGPAPLLGEHSMEVLAELGLDRARIDALVDAGAVVQAKGDA